MLTRDSGLKGEQIASDLLRQKGYKILTKNFRSRFGEVDIIALDGDTLVFVEVKMRSSRKFGLPEEAVNKYKIEKITKAGQYFRLLNKNLPERERIDVVAIEMREDEVVSLKIIKVD